MVSGQLNGTNSFNVCRTGTNNDGEVICCRKRDFATGTLLLMGRFTSAQPWNQLLNMCIVLKARLVDAHRSWLEELFDVKSWKSDTFVAKFKTLVHDANVLDEDACGVYCELDELALVEIDEEERNRLSRCRHVAKNSSILILTPFLDTVGIFKHEDV
uniref:Uncharacterized protein n=1 Tax=Trichuris muris TaxID=70415 RepID=A0A5S6R050_TRIMR